MIHDYCSLRHLYQLQLKFRENNIFVQMIYLFMLISFFVHFPDDLRSIYSAPDPFDISLFAVTEQRLETNVSANLIA